MSRPLRFRFIAFILFSAGVFLFAQEDSYHGERYPLYREMRSELVPFQEALPDGGSKIGEYYARCSAGTGAVRRSGTFTSLDMNMAVHVWTPQESDTPDDEYGAGSVIVLHGYLAHPVQMAPLIRGLLDAGFVVAAPELPGHGLSDGRRGYIADFSDYGTFLNDFMEQVGTGLPKPLHVVGFSTGASTAYEYLQTFGDPFGAIVFAAPLIRSYAYQWSRIGKGIAGIFVDSLKTGHHYPLGTETMPLAWFDALVRWDRENQAYGVFERPLLMVQGTRDRVVNGRYNRDYLERHFTPFIYMEVSGAEHVLFSRHSVDVDDTVVTVVAYIGDYPSAAVHGNEPGR